MASGLVSASGGVRRERGTTVSSVRCPACRAEDTKVVDSRAAQDGAAIRRRRACPVCGYRFTTFERMEEVALIVLKRSGEREPFSRSKLVAGLRAAAKGRPVTVDELETLATSVEDALRLDGPEVPSARIGLMVLDALRQLDEVAYLRFASVYKGFDEAADFQRELTLLAKGTPPKSH
jgi:transcriptional repressor NrdR